MRIKPDLVKRLRSERQWSQEQLAAACGLNLRTIQRLEKTGKASMESVRALAAVFELDSATLIVDGKAENAAPLDAVKTCFVRYAGFTGTATRFEYGWFFLFVLLVAAIGTLINHTLGQLVFLVLLLPLLAVGTRRLNDIGRSGWWQLLFLVPFGFAVVFYMLAQSGSTNTHQPSAA